MKLGEHIHILTKYWMEVKLNTELSFAWCWKCKTTSTIRVGCQHPTLAINSPQFYKMWCQQPQNNVLPFSYVSLHISWMRLVVIAKMKKSSFTMINCRCKIRIYCYWKKILKKNLLCSAINRIFVHGSFLKD